MSFPVCMISGVTSLCCRFHFLIKFSDLETSFLQPVPAYNSVPVFILFSSCAYVNCQAVRQKHGCRKERMAYGCVHASFLMNRSSQIPEYPRVCNGEPRRIFARSWSYEFRVRNSSSPVSSRFQDVQRRFSVTSLFFPDIF
ncbi:hypothetical protein SDC9_182238 [bioreactor metagenome]|uniref:Uncharacterized protein n=1 Tax=bioreactor metagenome TaxID=1076179 RepID=A0A645HF72_9ZZZZ